MGKPCVAGCSSLEISEKNKILRVKGKEFKEGDFITFDGSSGEVFEGVVPTIEAEISDDFATFMKWADEVRTLASRTQTSTEEISSIITSVQSQTQAVVSTMKGCRTKGTLSVESSQVAYQQIEAVMDEMQTILDSSTQIAAAVEEQSMVCNEVAQNIVVIRDTTTTHVEGVSDNTRSTEVVNQQTTDLRGAIEVFKVH